MSDPPSEPSDQASSPLAAAAVTGPPLPGGPSARHWPQFDREDLLRAQAGDPQALGRFFDHYFDRIFSVVQRFAADLEMAQDLTQEIFLKIRRHLGRLDLERDPAPWLYTIAVNACHDHRRSTWWRMSRNSVPLDHGSVELELSSQNRNPERLVLAAEVERRIHAAIRRLAPALRMSIILHDFEGLAHDQIAQITRIGHAAARKRHSRAILALAKLLKEGEVT